MPSPSPFDDLLSEFDDPLADPGRPRTDPLRGENLQALLDLSKKLEAIAKTLDPSEEKHPLHGQSIPDEARERLKALVDKLMQVQSDLQTLEQALLAEPAEHPDEPSDRPPEGGRRPPWDEPDPPFRDTMPRRTPDSFADDDLPPRPPRRSSTQEPNQTEPPTPSAPNHPSAPTTPPSPPAPPAAAPPPSPEDLAFKKEQDDFAAYKAQWEAAFQADPAQRAAHPEVAQYYEQMETYFKEKAAHLQSTQNNP